MDPSSLDKVTLPKQKQIRLPFHVSHIKPSQQVQRTCQICRKNPSPYACPRCNIPYCSLACYQSVSKHSQCSEPFFKQEIELEIGAQKGRTSEEKNKMWELLKKFEDGVGQEGMLNLEEEGLGEDPEDEEEGDDDGLEQLQEALEGIDIDSLSPEALLDLLPLHLREQFLSSLDTPDPSPLLQSLLDSEELAFEAEIPWWLPLEDDLESDQAGFVSRKGKRNEPPEAMTLPKEVMAMSISEEMGERMLYNVLAVAQAYVHTTLLFQRSPLVASVVPSPPSTAMADSSEPFKHDPILINLLSLVPFLSDPTSKTLFTSLSQTLVSLRSHAPPDDPLPPLPSTLLAPLLVPPIDLALPHPLSLLLSDLDALLVQAQSAEPDAKKRKEVGKTRKKVGFLAGCVVKVSRKRWLEIVVDVGKVFAEKDDDNEAQEVGEIGSDNPAGGARAEGTKVQEMDVYPSSTARPKQPEPPKFEEVVEDDDEDDDIPTEGAGRYRDLVGLESRVGLSEKMSGRAGGIGRIVEL